MRSQTGFMERQSLLSGFQNSKKFCSFEDFSYRLVVLLENLRFLFNYLPPFLNTVFWSLKRLIRLQALESLRISLANDKTKALRAGGDTRVRLWVRRCRLPSDEYVPSLAWLNGSQKVEEGSMLLCIALLSAPEIQQ